MSPYYARKPVATYDDSGNWPIYDERGRRIVMRWCWRKPSRPFAAPVCCRRHARRIGFNLYRCRRCAARIEPERLWHRLMLGSNPFRDNGSARDLIRVFRWAPLDKGGASA